ncbi:MAG: hypothetical protein CJD30_06465 [Sulfuricurvum sp. PD_MW2]|jgi:hypothetical protein|uniref:hypothetical protein n=1 Tax=Sulfuricurvum sp. PD_MW2 TaxID=2027917 RepID=UPI000C066B77|nr:hypothetical protein [Sulfuricurvum sp. PD_MW2]PHM17406.1 MAG: hypothetical protein CJD30_06465 [Sulfuricurvum sp. PD_MW2]
MKKTFWVTLVIAMVSFMSMGCMTSQLWEDKVTYTPYSETIDAFLLNAKNDETIFLGKKYHYIFDANPQFGYLLKHRENASITFNVSQGARFQAENDTLNARFSVTIDSKTIDQELQEWINDNHVSLNPKTKVYTIPISLKGKRYFSDRYVNEKAQQLSKEIYITVNEVKKEGSPVVVKILGTPIAVAADGVMFVVGMAIFIPVVIATSGH